LSILASIVGVLSFLGHTINTFFWVGPILIIALIKFILPFGPIRVICNFILSFFASSWISVNTFITKIGKSINWEIDIPTQLSTNNWYLVVANHQSWVDILAVQQIFNRKIPFLKFFLKQQLFWVPVLGLAWWALDFPFMKRFSKSYLKKNPHKRGKDLETTRKACEKFKTIPISIMNFAEGTRFSEAKRDKQNSPYKHLLKPKGGGVGYVLTLMGDEITHLLNITIQYPGTKKITFWKFLSGQIKHIHIHAELVEIPQEVKGNYIDESQVRIKTQQWLNQLWREKDQRLSQSRSSEESER